MLGFVGPFGKWKETELVALEATQFTLTTTTTTSYVSRDRVDLVVWLDN